MSTDERLRKCGAILYDLEIVRAVPQHGVCRDPDVYYCGGWEDYENMGISVLTAYDFVDAAFRIYLQDNLDEFRTVINSRNIVIGFNNRRFDDNVLAANKIHVPLEKNYDLWYEIVHTQPDGERKGFALDDLLIANKLQPKSGLGIHAPRWVQKGLWGKCINYCLDDTRLTLLLLRLACSDLMINPKSGGYIKIKKPWEVIDVEGGLFS